jgi:hypothetical protein
MGGIRGYAKYTMPGHKPELKFKDTSIALTAIDDGGTVIDSSAMVLVAQGNAESERHGRKIGIQRININGLILQSTDTEASASALQTEHLVRVVLLVDHQANGASATIGNIYEDNDILTHRNLENSSRFTVLKEKWVSIRAGSAYTDNGTNFVSQDCLRPWKMNLKCNIPIEYNSTTGAVTERPCNNLLLVAFSTNDNTANANRVRIRCQVRVRFYDY